MSRNKRFNNAVRMYATSIIHFSGRLSIEVGDSRRWPYVLCSTSPTWDSICHHVVMDVSVQRIRGVLVHDNALYKSTFYLLTYLLTAATCCESRRERELYEIHDKRKTRLRWPTSYAPFAQFQDCVRLLNFLTMTLDRWTVGLLKSSNVTQTATETDY